MGKWKKINLEKCIDSVNYPSKIPKKNFLECGKFPIVSQDKELISGYWMDEQDLFIIDKPIIVFGDHTKNIKYIDFNFVIGADGVKILQPKNFLDPKFLYYFLLAYPVKSLGYARHYRLLKETDIIFPELISEQKRIVEILDKAFEGIDRAIANTEKNLANAREIFDSYLNNIFCQKDGNWIENKLKNILSVQPRNGWSPPASNHSDVGIPVLTLSSVTGFKFNLNKVKFTNAPTQTDAYYWLKNGEFLMTRSNTPNLVGHVAICNGLEEPTICCDLIMKMEIDKNKAESEFIYWYFRTSKLREIITSSARGANPTMKKINKSIVQNFPVLIPPLSTQRKIIDQVNHLYEETQRLEAIYQRKLEALQELKQSILHKAFTGELTNPSTSLRNNPTIKEVAA